MKARSQNFYLMKSWEALTILMFCITMFVGIMPGMRALSGSKRQTKSSKPASRTRSTQLSSLLVHAWSKCKRAKQAYNDLFSFSRGRYHAYLRIVFEMIEVGTQTAQLKSFALERPLGYILALSVTLILNGLSMPAPLVLGLCLPACKRDTLGTGWN